MTTKQLDYVTCVIGALALMTGKSCSFIYKKLQVAGIIKDYLVAAYDVLHTFSLEYVAEDIIKMMKNKGYSRSSRISHSNKQWICSIHHPYMKL